MKARGVTQPISVLEQSFAVGKRVPDTASVTCLCTATKQRFDHVDIPAVGSPVQRCLVVMVDRVRICVKSKQQFDGVMMTLHKA